MTSKNRCASLEDLTGKESGIIIFDNNVMIICNWSAVSGIPHVFAGLFLMGVGEVVSDSEPEAISDIHAYLLNRYDGELELIWDVNDDINNLEGIDGELYVVNDDITVIVPSDWH